MFVYPQSKRAQLNSLSQEVWGVPSKWMTILNKGLLVVDEEHPLTKRPIRSHVEYYTLEELETLMQELKLKKKENTPSALHEG